MTAHLLTMMVHAYREISAIRNCVTGVTIDLFLRTQVRWRHEARGRNIKE